MSHTSYNKEYDVARLANVLGLTFALKPSDLEEERYAIYTDGLEFKMQGTLEDCYVYLLEEVIALSDGR